MIRLDPQARARLQEARLYLATHPGWWLLAEASRRFAVVRLPGFGALVNDPDVGRAILLRDEVFTKSGPGSMGAVYTQVMGPYALLNMDGEEHLALRRKLGDLFSPAGVRALADRVCAEPLARLRADLAAGRAVDLVRTVRDLSGRMTCHLLGLTPAPGDEAATYRRLVDLSERLAAFAPTSARPFSSDRLRQVRRPFDELTEMARETYEAADGPSDSIIRRLRELDLSFEEVRGVVASMCVVGTQTVSVAAPRLVALLVDTGQYGTLRRCPRLLPGAIDEGLRCIVPSPAMMRVARADTEIAGHRFRAGTRVILLTYNMARSADYFPDPLRFDVERQPDPRARHLWFGAGAHFCLGFALARREMRLILEALLGVPGLLVVERRRPARGVFLPSYARLVVRCRP